MKAPATLEPHQIDALREVANIGAGHAATALSKLTNRAVMISVSEAALLPREEVWRAPQASGGPVLAVAMTFLGDLTGRTLLVMTADAARVLVNLLLGRPADAAASFGELESSSLTEAGNILGGAYLNAVGALTGIMPLMTTPQLIAEDSATAMADHIGLGPAQSVVLCLETDFCFEEAGRSLRAQYLLAPDAISIRPILDAIRVA